jgi:hypothetical protein
MRVSATHSRAGLSTVWALVVMATVSALSASIIFQFLAARQRVDLHRHRAQAAWLARAGAELAAAKLLAGDEGYAGETLSPVPRSEVRIVVTRDANGVYRVESEARYPVGERGMAVKAVARTVKRDTGGKGVRVEYAADPDPSPPPKN